MRFLGVDTGGTFTDFVYFDGSVLRIHKVLSNPGQPEQAILQGIDDLGLETSGLQLIHGSTVATNALLEGKGAATAYITNTGFTDILSIGRQARTELYNLTPTPPAPPVPQELCFGLNTRQCADGRITSSITAIELEALVAKLSGLNIKAVAINLLFSFLDSQQEQFIAQALPEHLFISCSSDVLPEYREYERGIATWINASLSPLMQHYLAGLAKKLKKTSISVMQSNGGTMTAERAGQQAVQLLLSGPAGGLMGARAMAACAGHDKLLTFDMGGTSTDVALIQGDIQLTTEGQIGRYPIAIPMVDMHTIGAGGGSIATADAGGLLHVGPESAGAMPGPACYGQGGKSATVTDANVMLGRLPASANPGGNLQLNPELAFKAIDKLARQLSMGPIQTAAGILAVANEHMAQALRVISVERGADISDHTLVSFGGAGGLHVCALAELINMRSAMIPAHGGVLSALGMLLAPRQRLLSKTVNGLLEKISDQAVNREFDKLQKKAELELAAEGISAQDLSSRYSIDLRYRGQSYALELPWHGCRQATPAFHRAHHQRYGHEMDLPIELVNLRINVTGPPSKVKIPEIKHPSEEPKPIMAEVHGVTEAIPVYQRLALPPGFHLAGPAIIVESIATTFVEDRWTAQVDNFGNLLLLHNAKQQKH